MLSLDIDYGTRELCSLRCPHCFRKDNRADSDGDGVHEIIYHDKMIKIIEKAKDLGLKSVKFLGAGEPFEAETESEKSTKSYAKGELHEFHFLEFLRYLKRKRVVPSIFTKGHVIGDDNLVKKYYSGYGIFTGEELAEELNRVNASILLGFNSFDTNVQDAMVGSLGPNAIVKDYTIKRNRALELLVNAGFNKPNPTRLCLAINPVTKANYPEVLEIYEWARVRNLYPIVCPTMVSGRCSQQTAWQNINPTDEQLIDLYTKIYEFNIREGIQTLEQIREEGVSSYAGGNPCNQIGCGMYITVTGTVLRCPGDDVSFLGNIWTDSLRDIWVKSENYRLYRGKFNCGCPPKVGKSIPQNLFAQVIKRLENN